jgi:hypothetical protein
MPQLVLHYGHTLNLFGSDHTAVNIEYLYMGGPEAMRSIGIGFHRYFGRFNK